MKRKRKLFVIEEVMGPCMDTTEYLVYRTDGLTELTGTRVETSTKCGQFKTEWQARLELIRQIA